MFCCNRWFVQKLYFRYNIKKFRKLPCSPVSFSIAVHRSSLSSGRPTDGGQILLLISSHPPPPRSSNFSHCSLSFSHSVILLDVNNHLSRCKVFPTCAECHSNSLCLYTYKTREKARIAHFYSFLLLALLPVLYSLILYTYLTFCPLSLHFLSSPPFLTPNFVRNFTFFISSYSVSSIPLYRTASYCTKLYCTVLYCSVLYCTVLFCSVYLCQSHYYHKFLIHFVPCSVQSSIEFAHITCSSPLTLFHSTHQYTTQLIHYKL